MPDRDEVLDAASLARIASAAMGGTPAPERVGRAAPLVRAMDAAVAAAADKRLALDDIPSDHAGLLKRGLPDRGRPA